ncbi:NAD(P)H-dependent glycerol-3-phosphate dehydrogenase [Desertifilum sp. FACHB-1129]|uniref:Glycerol-3-phosphate dehydrogenase [NAD(P)+] n=1 Tax=Desertifilum tharense IPPAS B-1220 TaxID=1781255 RepID=A0A1E5QRN8_9CYAN|nr:MULTISPECIES: NAD(P)H-dependent glycerol-3-phosphate dehydrogenase [Desertifilum]MDA0211905.1 NAD(P)H-dependent glycerol-3-phosphate dehydrogenase [Cyanobacteria bacterium FC1]MBD2314028.1 NAD(P)H-dependent glycerol-3-phosphate dehydrogenase [Desertifilum sp. FACHB-1129]MBD2320354.1 NAD(P)H-dependent glycerol-3-phosphate dehydrogenase [Desertifilum sp. FACHB-866]MBD2330482.1 NAD(P)H-dependent glycerol-3-phosphate dehydrogenase [Desertifilum sp. FACHB-868]OEJ77257.1 glycerol-3-phosphate dehy
MNDFKTIAIVGAGAWGQALARLARDRHHQVKLWSRRGIYPLAEVVEPAEIIISAVSMKGVRSVAQQIQALSLSPHTIFVTATKGLDPEKAETPSQIWQSFFPRHPIVVLAGPNLSKEIQQGLPCATTVASTHLEAAETVQRVLSSPQFRVYTNADPLGVELGGTLKNVLAIAAGACDGLQLGTNAKAALLTRGLTEMIRIGTYWGAQAETFYGLSGLGDMLATCNSPLSRNYQLGYQLAQGKTLDEILAKLEGTAEGANTAGVLIRLASEQNIPIPISYQVNRLLQGEITAREAVTELMLRDIKPE